MASLFTRHPANPIVVPGLYPWRQAVTFNPGVLYEDGRFWMYERASGGLRPFHCDIGLLVSDDGVNFDTSSITPSGRRRWRAVRMAACKTRAWRL